MSAFGSASAPLRQCLFLLHDFGHLLLQLRSIDSFHLDHAIGWFSDRLREQRLDSGGMVTQGRSIGEHDGTIESGDRTRRASFEFEGSLHLFGRIIINDK